MDKQLLPNKLAFCSLDAYFNLDCVVHDCTTPPDYYVEEKRRVKSRQVVYRSLDAFIFKDFLE